MADPVRSKPEIIQWVIDTRSLWPVPKREKSKDEVAELRTAVRIDCPRGLPL